MLAPDRVICTGHPTIGIAQFADSYAALMHLRLKSVSLILAVVLLGTACSASFNFSAGDGAAGAVDTAEELIEGVAMMQRLNIDPITDASCEEPAELEVGTVFNCTATSDGKTIEFEVEVMDEDTIFAAPQNMVSADVLGTLTREAVQSLNEQNGFNLAPDALDCGTGGVVLDANDAMFCELTDQASGARFETQITIRDIDTGAFNIQVLSELE